jgi:two-component system, chemotaxis family, protein-glutamate methylesterase/glutaminase
MDRVIVIGASAGGLHILTQILSSLQTDYPYPIIVIQHRANDREMTLEHVLQHKCRLRVKQADEKEQLTAGVAFIAPPGYHLLIEQNYTFSLAADSPVKFSIPSIDVTFESAAEVIGDRLIGILLTGASNDGAAGIRAIKSHNGITIVQSPAEAEYPLMPQSAIATGAVDFVWKTNDIKQFLAELASAARKIK